MKILNIKKSITLLFIILISYIFIPVPNVFAYSNPAVIPLLTVTNFAALAKSTITSPTGPTVLNNGDMGLDTPAVCTNFIAPCTGTINGTISGGSIQYQNAVALQGQTDATAAVTNIGLRTADQTIAGGLLGGLTLNQGIYDIPATPTNLTGDLTLNGDANSVFILHATSTLITATGSRVLLTGGAQACNVFWKVDTSATINGTTHLVGTILAQASTTFPGGGATLDGRVVAQTAAINFNNTTVNNSSCTVATTSTSSSSNSSSTDAGGSSALTCPALASTIIAPTIIQSRRVDADSIFISWSPYSGVDTFNVRYGPASGNWLFNTNVTGFSTTINNLPSNQTFWFEVAARNACAIGSYGPAMQAGGPLLPNAGFAPHRSSILDYFLDHIFILSSFFLRFISR